MKHFGLHKATMNNTDPNGTNFYVATDFIPGTTTGVYLSRFLGLPVKWAK